ncbi:hypothetical protein TOPH_08584 [Tolypocladium ophioglossoides CBS 100239]|uniref:LrgB-like protein n=1 Tax=Tolypocladium ophioglossoides (strain CBS 100239) TaxID=1163406 RepID=A0A0L0MYA5_TOLOC|nr:hypothetical protein TOPH_08584 [Tolypocladium ophioglossoides CBS 100239]
MATSTIWRKRWLDVLLLVVDLLWVVIIYLAGELIIWGLSRALALADFEFFASILGMLLVFSSMTVAGWLCRSCDQLYNKQVRSKINLINAHLGVGFPIPIVMMNRNDALDGRQIARIIGTFVSTNVFSWATVFLLPLLILTGIKALKSWEAWHSPAFPRQANAAVALCCGIWGTRLGSDSWPTSLEAGESPYRNQQTALETEPTRTRSLESPTWNVFAANCPSILALCGIFAVGLPVALGTKDERLLDGFVMWFIWITAVRLQQVFGDSSLLSFTTQVKSVLSTLANPVLATTLFMVAYTRAKAAAIKGRSLSRVLATFSSGTPLYALWTSNITGILVSSNPSSWFGAGDAALSLLECDILTWGFKLYECRRQLFTLAGVLTVVFGVAAAAGNVFLSVLAGRAIGLDGPEALAFAARCTTLALARPAIQSVGGNAMVNATLVVSNGILGQLMYPFVLDKLGVRPTSRSESDRGVSSSETLVEMENPAQSSRDKMEETLWQEDDSQADDAVTIAAGVAIGVNGAAMGVSYLYETKSRAAPYAALSMTVFGVMTVVFTTVDPFKSFVMRLASS